MSYTNGSQAMLNHQSLFEEQMNLFSFPSNYHFPNIINYNCNQSMILKAISPNSLLGSCNTQLTETLISSSSPPAVDFGGPQLLSLQRSTPNLWAWGEEKESNNIKRNGNKKEDHDQHLRASASMKMKKIIKGRRKVREPRFCFKTLTDVDVLDDGYKWRKYGQKDNLETNKKLVDLR
ncbi:hypothetical protein ACFE04_017304 [Oxalis oulophora]